jgi:hypothetical protein
MKEKAGVRCRGPICKRLLLVNRELTMRHGKAVRLWLIDKTTDKCLQPLSYTSWNGKEELDMLNAVKQSVHRLTSHLQLISSYLEVQDYTNALGRAKETIKEMHALEASLTGLANVGMTVPKDGAVVVPHGSTVVSHEDVNVDVDSDEVRTVDKDEVRDGYGNDNPKTK